MWTSGMLRTLSLRSDNASTACSTVTAYSATVVFYAAPALVSMSSTHACSVAGTFTTVNAVAAGAAAGAAAALAGTAAATAAAATAGIRRCQLCSAGTNHCTMVVLVACSVYYATVTFTVAPIGTRPTRFEVVAFTKRDGQHTVPKVQKAPCITTHRRVPN
jgi:hypothetical protein